MDCFRLRSSSYGGQVVAIAARNDDEMLSFRGDAMASNPESRTSGSGACAPSRNDGARFPYSPARNSFTLSVDGMFTTFSEPPFTNTFEANARKHAVHCL